MTETVLIVDDSLTVRMDLRESLEGAGFQAVLCSTAAEARAAMARERVALIVLDVLLPDGDGVELLREIRANLNPSPPILLLSSEADVKDRIRGLQTGADDYVGKPYDAHYIVARARELVWGAAGPSTGGRSTILLVDDSVTFREELREALENEGYQVITAASGEEGLRLAGTGRANAIVVDGVMPGIDGATVIRKIRLDAALRRLPCVLLTGSEGRGSELRALDAGADAFVRKEEDLGVILARLAAVLRSAHADREGVATLLGPKRILAVDDSLTFLHEVATTLRGDGYDVILAHSGEEALEMLSVQSVDCILLDLLMPGLDGRATCARIKSSRATRDIPLVMLTALEDRTAMIDGLSTGADDFISKSNEFDVLKARVRAQIRRKQIEDEHRKIREELLRHERDAAEERAARTIAEARAHHVEELERKNKELEAFSYSVAHDLRAPLRAIDGFSHALLDEYGATLDAQALGYLQRVRTATKRMGDLIDDLLELSRLSRAALRRSRINLSKLAEGIVTDLRTKDPTRTTTVAIEPDIVVDADPGLARIVLDNLLGNAWKFTSKKEDARIELGARQASGELTCFVKDNGAGFDMDYAERLFAPFQRLHDQREYPGTGIGLATVARIVQRHGGRVWAEGAIGSGATVYFTMTALGVSQSLKPKG